MRGELRALESFSTIPRLRKGHQPFPDLLSYQEFDDNYLPSPHPVYSWGVGFNVRVHVAPPARKARGRSNNSRRRDIYCNCSVVRSTRCNYFRPVIIYFTGIIKFTSAQVARCSCQPARTSRRTTMDGLSPFVTPKPLDQSWRKFAKQTLQ